LKRATTDTLKILHPRLQLAHGHPRCAAIGGLDDAYQETTFKTKTTGRAGGMGNDVSIWP
jgi:hypothetical protein